MHAKSPTFRAARLKGFTVMIANPTIADLNVVLCRVQCAHRTVLLLMYRIHQNSFSRCVATELTRHKPGTRHMSVTSAA